MTNAISIARPYATAAFEAAKSADQLSMWSLALKKLSIVAKDQQMHVLLKNPCYSKNQLSAWLIEILHAVSGNGAADAYKSIENFIHLLAEKKRLLLLPDIAQLFEADVAKESGYISLIVTSAFAMDEAQKKETQNKLEKQFNSKCDIEFRVDEKLVGGLLVRSGNWVMDGTISGQLARLKSALI